MTFEETRDNTTDIEAAIIAADAHETDPRPFRQPEERHEEHNDGANGYDEPDPAGVQLEAEADNRRPGGELVKSWDDPEDPEHDEIGDAETEYDIEFDDEPEDDGQPSEYEEWQDFMGGDEHYDHSENEMW